MNFNNSHRDRITSIYLEALKAVNGKRCVAQHLLDNEIEGDVYLLAIGKAALAMTEGAIEILDSRVKAGLIITHQQILSEKVKAFNVVESAHPIPDQRSIEAGKQLLTFIDELPANATLLCLISGGSSAMVEVLPEGVGIEQLQQLNNWLLKTGLPIDEINAIRKRVSLIKGGRLATRLKQQRVIVLLISDVKGDDPSDIGSGLLFAPTDTESHIRPTDYPTDISRIFGESPDLPSRDDPCFRKIEFSLVATLNKAKQAAYLNAVNRGYDVIVHQEYLQGDANEAGVAIANELKRNPGNLHVWGGECTVKLPLNPGTGGRCQSLALSAAIEMHEQLGWCLLAAGTDGSDGTLGVAGACVDSESLLRAGDKYVNIELAREYLHRADAGSYLNKTNDLIVTGDTGTNVADLVLAYCE